MSKYLDTITEQFKNLSHLNFSVDRSYNSIFLCGGEINIKNDATPSFRDRLLRYVASNHPDLEKHFTLAENFKDYFKENIYTDLLVFEEDIANISTLVLIILESPGALVELGMFCNKQVLYKKLLIVVNHEYVKEQDSFIFLGPLEYIKRKETTSVAEYPWSENIDKDGDSAALEDLVRVIRKKLEKYPDSEKFKVENSGHIALLVAEIIDVCSPVLFTEIELALIELELDITHGQLHRALYLLLKLKIIGSRSYGDSYKFYYPINPNQKKVLFGKTKTGVVSEASKMQMAMRQSYVLEKDELSQRRVNVLKLIIKERS